MWAAIKSRLRRSEAEPAPSPSGGSSGPAPPRPAPAAPSSPEPFTDSLLGRRIRDASLEEITDQLEIALLQSDVALPVAERLISDLKRNLAGKRLRWGADLESAVRASLERSVRAILSKPGLPLAETIRAHRPKPYVILFLGVNGTGKTTSIAKLSGWLRREGLSCVIAAGDTFRAGAIEQLLVHGERLGIRVVRQQEGSDPAAVAYDAIEHARAKGVDVVLVDTAGRQHTNENLVAEAQKIRRVAHPALTLFVGDALSGNDVVEQARLFHSSLGLDGLILTKLDADVKGGAALSTVFTVDKPILFFGTGQGYDDLRPFDPEWMIQRLFREGDGA
ncbi:MAG: signal recognition particle-docking protein FtsY [Thermoplasmata archaeon]